MAAIVLPSTSKTQVFGPFHMPSRQRSNSKAQAQGPLIASSSRSPEASTSSFQTSDGAPEVAPKTLGRLRSSFEQSLKLATRSKVKVPAADDEFATITPKGKGKDKARYDDAAMKDKDKGRSNMLKRLESKVGLRRTRRDSATTSSTPIPPQRNESREHVNNAEKGDQVRVAGFTSFMTPSLRQASMSSPALQLSSQDVPSPNSQQTVMASSTSSNSGLPSSSRDRTRRASMQPTKISGPQPLAPRRELRGGITTTDRNGAASPRANKTRPPPIFTPSPFSIRSSIDTPRKSSDLPSTHDSPSPPPSSRGRLGNPAKEPGAPTIAHVPLDCPLPSPTPGRPVSPAQARTPSRRVVTPTSNRGLVSTSATNLSLGSISPTSSPVPPRKPSVDAPRQPILDSERRPCAGTPSKYLGDISRRTSKELPRRGSMDTQRRPTASPPPRATSPSPVARPRAASPSQRPLANVHNRNFNVSSASLVSPSTPEQRERIRTATSLLCKELRRPPPHLSRSENQREWAEVEVRLQPLVRLERVWGKSGVVPGASSSQVAVTGSTVISSAGEERERKLFCEALRDGVVLCQLLNKHIPSLITRIDTKEDGFKRTSNITKFLAACSSYGVPSDDLFYRDDLVEATPEALCRVARTIVALLSLFESPVVDRSKVICGQGPKGAADMGPMSDPYSPTSLSRAASSTPNLAPQRSLSPTPSPPRPGRTRWTPPEPALPPLRSDSPHSGTSSGTARNITSGNGRTPPAGNSIRESDVASISTSSPPKSPLRTRSQSKHTDDGDATLPTDLKPLHFPSREPVSPSSSPTTGDYGDDRFPMRQSRTSSNLTENTAYSSLFDNRRSSVQNKFGTVRTVTTEATSLGSEAPSFTRTEASSVAASLAEEMGRRRNGSLDASRARERRPSEPSAPDLMSLAEEEENSACGSSSRETHRGQSNARGDQRGQEVDKHVRVRLGKGKWPDDFLGAFQSAGPSRPIPIHSTPGRAESPMTSSPLSASPTRKLSIVGASRHNDNSDAVPRRPSHRTRHSADAPILMPKEPILRREASPESPISGSPGSRVVLRRQSTRNSARRNGMYVPRSNVEDPERDGDPCVIPFPRAVSGEHSTPATPSPDSPQDSDRVNDMEPSRPRSRFQSEMDDPRARRRSRPNSYDELGRPRRARYENIIHLGVASSNEDASDLLGRDSMDGSAVRQTIVVEEEGKLAVHFQLGNCIGRGQFGTVYRALNLTTGQMVAVKRIRLEGLKEEEVTQLMNEVDLMKSLSHPSIVKYEGMARDEGTLDIVLEYAESGSLGQTLKAFGKLNERLVASYVVKILEGLHYLHRCQVVHCDLKAANILTTKTGNVKLSDFGVSLNLRAMEREMNNVAGTPNWMAPEVIELKGASTKSDIWSLGCTVIELLTGRPPYGDIANSMTVMFRIVEDEMPPLPEGCSEALQDFLRQCFNKNPELRPDAETLCEHPWLKKNWDALKELRPQDSIPFLRRVSADLQKTDIAKLLVAVDTPILESPTSEITAQESSRSPTDRRKLSFGPTSPMSDDPLFSPRDHSFVKTTFGKPMVCRVCLGSVKKSAVICDHCNLIAHSKCAREAPPTCDLRSQLLLYAQYAEKGNPVNVYSAPSPHPHPSTTVPSEVSFVTPRPNDAALSGPDQSVPGKSHGAFRFITGLGRSRSSLSVASPSSSPSPVPPPTAEDKAPRRKSSKLGHIVGSKERPHSLSSDSTSPKSLKTADSQSSRQETGRKSFLSFTESDASPQPRNHGRISDTITQKIPLSVPIPAPPGIKHPSESTPRDIPGALPNGSEPQKNRGGEKASNCTIQ
ncbi:hypothetical protein F5I97DRAFT_1975393 [Phlebopus sp. FC_14]|nr:hypothetical protein F5I97DRAFT_1975393 [Phlebopus sp. FC_14]